MAVLRNHTGCRCGASHHRAKVADAVVAEARALRDRGWPYSKITEHLNNWHGLSLSMWTVRDWADDRTRGLSL